MEERKCVQCGKTFQISDSEKDFYVKKNLHLPKRCNECRKKNNPQKENQKKSTHPYLGHRNNKPSGTNSKKTSALTSVLLLIGVFFLVGIFYFSSKIDVWFPDQATQQEAYVSPQQEITQAPLVVDVTQDEDAPKIEDSTQAEDTLQVEETTDAEEVAQVEEADQPTESSRNLLQYHFRSTDLLEEHFVKHGSDFGFETASEYEKGANAVILSSAALTKREAEDGDMVYYLESTNEIVFLSQDNYIRTYFKPDSGKEYFDKQ